MQALYQYHRSTAYWEGTLWPEPAKGASGRGGVEDTRLEAKDTKKNPRPRPRTAFPRTNPLEAKDRNARGQGQGPRTQAQVLSKKKKGKVFTKIYLGDLQKKKRSSQKFLKRTPQKNVFQKFFKRSTKF